LQVAAARATAPDGAGFKDLQARIAKAQALFEASGAHYIVDTVADVPAIIEQIQQRIEKGETPFS
jgi:phosphonoacetaldehyde hydrolase